MARRINFAESAADAQARELAYRLCNGPGDERSIARFHLNRKNGDRPRATLPESITAWYLNKFREPYEEQGDIAGGRARREGAVIDFWLPIRRLVLLVHGDYWHDDPATRERDFDQKQRLLTSDIAGIPIDNVITIWESGLLSCQRETHVRNAIAGIESTRRQG